MDSIDEIELDFENDKPTQQNDSSLPLVQNKVVGNLFAPDESSSDEFGSSSDSDTRKSDRDDFRSSEDEKSPPQEEDDLAATIGGKKKKVPELNLPPQEPLDTAVQEKIDFKAMM